MAENIPQFGKNKEQNMNENNLLQNAQNRFLADEFFMLSWASAVQHNKVWNEIETDAEKNEFRRKMQGKIESLLLSYADASIESKQHIINIEQLKEFSKIEGEELKIGTVQKLFNMMCKYYWCAGWIKEPPHLPIDRLNFERINKKGINWTEIEDIDSYKKIIELFAEVAEKENLSLSVWVVINWHRRSAK